MVQPFNAVGAAVVEENRAERRAIHNERAAAVDTPVRKAVEDIEVVGYFDPTSIKFDRFHSLNLTISILPEMTDEALELRHMAGVPITIRFTKRHHDDEDDGD